MTLRDKLNQAKNYGYTLKFITEQANINVNTLYAYMDINRNYTFGTETLNRLQKVLDTLYFDNSHNYTVYIHRNLINNKVYIGLTRCSTSRRWKNGEGYKKQPHFYSAIKKYGWDNFEHLIIQEYLTREEASKMQQKLILKYDALNPDKGYNKREGGIENYQLTEEQRKARGWAKGLHFTEQHKMHIGQSLKGRQFSQESRLKMSEAKKKVHQYEGKNNPKATKVQCVETGQIFDTIKEAAQWCGLSNYSSISKVCRGKQKTAGKYHWIYYNKEELT